MTSKQRAAARLFTDYRTSKRLLDDQLSLFVSDREYFGTGAPPPTTSEVVRELKCSSNSVFIARVLQAVSLPIEDGTFLFTEYHVLLEEDFRLDSRSSQQLSRHATLVRPGGSMVVDGVAVIAERASFPHLEVGKRYLIFATYLPDPLDLYKTADGNGMFLLSQGKGRTVREQRTADGDLHRDGLTIAELTGLIRRLGCR